MHVAIGMVRTSESGWLALVGRARDAGLSFTMPTMPGGRQGSTRFILLYASVLCNVEVLHLREAFEAIVYQLAFTLLAGATSEAYDLAAGQALGLGRLSHRDRDVLSGVVRDA